MGRELPHIVVERRDRVLDSRLRVGGNRPEETDVSLPKRLLARSRTDRYATARQTLDAWRAADPTLVP